MKKRERKESEVCVLRPLRHLVTSRLLVSRPWFPVPATLAPSRDPGIQRATPPPGVGGAPPGHAEPAAGPLCPFCLRTNRPKGATCWPEWRIPAGAGQVTSAPGGPGLWALLVLTWPVKAGGKLQPPKVTARQGHRVRSLGRESLVTAHGGASSFRLRARARGQGARPGRRARALAEGRAPGLTRHLRPARPGGLAHFCLLCALTHPPFASVSSPGFA